MTYSPRTWQEQREAEKAVVTAMRKEWLEGLARDHSSRADIAKTLGVPRAWVYKLARRCGAVLPKAEKLGRAPNLTPERLREFADQGMTLKQTASALGCQYNNLSAKARAFGIKFKSGRPGPAPKTPKKKIATPKPPAPAPQPTMTMAEFAARENAAMRRRGIV